MGAAAAKNRSSGEKEGGARVPSQGAPAATALPPCRFRPVSSEGLRGGMVSIAAQRRDKTAN
jgi:hypothetical protein